MLEEELFFLSKSNAVMSTEKTYLRINRTCNKMNDWAKNNYKSMISTTIQLDNLFKYIIIIICNVVYDTRVFTGLRSERYEKKMFGQ